MQYVTGYILPNELDVLLHTDGTERRFEKVYERPIKLYKEFNNSFTIVVKNQDQKKQFVNDASCELQISNEDDQLVITKTGVVQDDGSSTATKGHIKFTLSESDMLKLDQTFYHGVLKFTGNDSTVSILYADTKFDAKINFEVVQGTSPEFKASTQLDAFTLLEGEFITSSVDAKPNNNSNDGLHTAVYYLNNFSGTIKILGTMTAGASYATDAQQSEFFVIDSQEYAEETGRRYVNFTGVFKRVAFAAHHSDSTGAPDSSTVLSGLDKILYRS